MPWPRDVRRPTSRLRAAEGEVIKRHARWSWWATLTFTDILPRWRADDALRAFLRRLARHEREHLPIAWLGELQARGVWRYHGLIALPPWSGLDSADMSARWQATDHLALLTFITRTTPRAALPTT